MGEGDIKGEWAQNAWSACKTALEETPHFGVLEQLFEAETSRADYTLFLCSQLMRVKKDMRGLNMYTSVSDNQSLLTYAQAYAIALNWGHLFGTYSTERALLYHIVKSSREQEFVGLFGGQNERFKPLVRRVLHERDFYSMHKLLAVFRASKGQPNVETVLRWFLAPDDNVQPHVRDRGVWAFEVARRLAYHQLHEEAELPVRLIGVSSEELIAQLRDDALLQEPLGASVGTSVLELLGTFERYHVDQFFNTPHAARLVLNHLHEFRLWAGLRKDAPLESLIEALWSKPDDWPDGEGEERELENHYVRFDLPTRQKWIDVVEGLGPDPAIWTASNFIVTPSSGRLMCDVYTVGKSLEHSAARSVAMRLSQELKDASRVGVGSEHTRMLERACAQFMRAQFEELLPTELSVSLTAFGTKERSWTGFIGHDKTAISALAVSVDQLGQFGGHLGQERSVELTAVLDELHRLDQEELDLNEPWGVLLTKTSIYDDERERGEYDGVLCSWGQEATTWLIFEVKNQKKEGRAKTKAKGQLNNLSEMLRDEWCGELEDLESSMLRLRISRS